MSSYSSYLYITFHIALYNILPSAITNKQSTVQLRSVHISLMLRTDWNSMYSRIIIFYT